MRHRLKGRKLGRNASHRKALMRNMACSLIRSVRVDETVEKSRVAGRIVTTVAKAKELRPYVEKLVTMARKAARHEQDAAALAVSAEKNTAEWKKWRDSEKWNQWNQAVAPAVAMRRRAFALLRDPEAVDILFDDLASRFESRPGGYTRVIRLAEVRLGDAGPKAFIEFVGNHDRTRQKRKAPVVSEDADEPAEKPKSRSRKKQSKADAPAAEEEAAD